MLRAFKKMDENGDGYISHSELEKALTTVSKHLENQLIRSHTGFWGIVLKYSEKL